MALTVLINEPPYVNDKAWNALRLAQTALAGGNPVNIFLMGDAVYVARKGQQPGPDRPDLEEMLANLVEQGADLRVCTTCINARPYEPTGEYQSCFIGTQSGERLGSHHLISGVRMGQMADLVEWALDTKIVSF